MELFLPTAHMDINLLLILVFGGAVGFLSGLVGVGGGFLITPLLIFIGVPPLLAVCTGAAQIAGASAGGTYAGSYTLDDISGSLGPQEITGNLTVNNNGHLTMTGTLWVHGNLLVSNNASISLDPSFDTIDILKGKRVLVS